MVKGRSKSDFVLGNDLLLSVYDLIDFRYKRNISTDFRGIRMVKMCCHHEHIEELLMSLIAIYFKIPFITTVSVCPTLLEIRTFPLKLKST